MPLYAYRCPVCNKTEDAVRTIAERHKGPLCCTQMSLEIMPTHVTTDIQPYMAVAGDKAGQYITSRREHREYLKRNRLVEVGNEPMKPIRNDTRPKKGEIAQELKKVIPQVIHGRR